MFFNNYNVIAFDALLRKMKLLFIERCNLTKNVLINRIMNLNFYMNLNSTLTIWILCIQTSVNIVANCKYRTCQLLHHFALIDSDVFPYKLKKNLTRDKITS